MGVLDLRLCCCNSFLRLLDNQINCAVTFVFCCCEISPSGRDFFNSLLSCGQCLVRSSSLVYSTFFQLMHWNSHRTAGHTVNASSTTTTPLHSTPPHPTPSPSLSPPPPPTPPPLLATHTHTASGEPPSKRRKSKQNLTATQERQRPDAVWKEVWTMSPVRCQSQ